MFLKKVQKFDFMLSRLVGFTSCPSLRSRAQQQANILEPSQKLITCALIRGRSEKINARKEKAVQCL